MPKAVKLFMRDVDAGNRRVGRIAMYRIAIHRVAMDPVLVMMAILLWSSLPRRGEGSFR